MRQFLIYLLLIVFSNINAIDVYDSLLIELRRTSQLIHQPNSIEVRSNAASKLNELMDYILFTDSLQLMGWDSVAIEKVESADGVVKVFTWSAPMKMGQYKYYGYVQIIDTANETYFYTRLIDNSKLDTTVKSDTNWYGCLYYSIIQQEWKNVRYYTLLGVDFNDLFTSKKIIDNLTIDKKNKRIVFGKTDFFFYNKWWYSRLVLEYSARVTMSLKYNNNSSRIIFDHLSPSAPKFEGNYEHYGPDFTFDGLEWKFGQWVHVSDIDVRQGK